jgi:hypothetical protein
MHQHLRVLGDWRRVSSAARASMTMYSAWPPQFGVLPRACFPGKRALTAVATASPILCSTCRACPPRDVLYLTISYVSTHNPAFTVSERNLRGETQTGQESPMPDPQPHPWQLQPDIANLSPDSFTAQKLVPTTILVSTNRVLTIAATCDA